jgi:hypothetical protein
MKKLMLFSSIVALAVLFSCKDKEKPRDETVQTFNVEIYRMGNDSIEVPDESAVWLFDSLDFDFDNSRYDWEYGKEMTLSNGEKVVPLLRGSANTNIHTLEKIKNGSYYIFIYCHTVTNNGDFCKTYPWGYRRITVDKNIHEQTLKIVFTDDDRLMCSHGQGVSFIEK